MVFIIQGEAADDIGVLGCGEGDSVHFKRKAAVHVPERDPHIFPQVFLTSERNAKVRGGIIGLFPFDVFLLGTRIEERFSL